MTAPASAGSGDVEAILAQQLTVLQSAFMETQRAHAISSSRKTKYEEMQNENRSLKKQLTDAGLDPDVARGGAGQPQSPTVQQAWATCNTGGSDGGFAPGSKLSPVMPMNPGIVVAPPSLTLAPIMPVNSEESQGTTLLHPGGQRSIRASVSEQGKPKASERSKKPSGQSDAAARLASRMQEDKLDESAYPKEKKAVFADAAALKEKLRQNMSKPPYNVANFYWETGRAQQIARSVWFENTTLAVIALNALWISIDTDYNFAEILIEADPVFIVAENFFCTYFFGEWLTRYLSFKQKKKGLRDAWFVFDSTLVFMMVMETWVMTIIILIIGGENSGSLGNASILRLFRLMRLSRMARMARLLRAMPELMVLIKGMVVAMRSVFFTLCLLAGILYVFGIAFVQLMKDTPAGEKFFNSVPAAMNSLLLQGVLPDEAAIIEEVGADGWIFKVIILLYIVLAGLCVMNMLVGVLCEVVSVVSAVEKESLLVNYVKGTLQHMLTTSGIDADGDHKIAKHEFEALLDMPGAAKAIQEVGVDVVGLMDFTDFIFKDGRELSFPDFMDMVLQLRGSNNATVKDVVDLRKHLTSELSKFSETIQDQMDDALVDFMPKTPGPAPINIQYTMPGSQVMPVNDLGPEKLSWASSAAARLSSAANELSAAAGELAAHKKQAKLGSIGSIQMAEQAPLNSLNQCLSLEDD